MSAKEIIEQIKALPASEQAEVKRFACELPDHGQESNVLNERAGPMPSEMFERAKTHVFAHYGPLLDKLAK